MDGRSSGLRAKNSRIRAAFETTNRRAERRARVSEELEDNEQEKREEVMRRVLGSVPGNPIEARFGREREARKAAREASRAAEVQEVFEAFNVR